MYEQTRYRRTYLTEVVVRVDWLESLPSIAKKLPKSLSQRAKKSFPIAEPTKKKVRQVQITVEGIEEHEAELTEWTFHDKDRSKTLTIAPGSLFIRYTSYDSFEALRVDFTDIFAIFFSEFKDIQVSRFGLRYINNIELDEPEPLEWEGYINEKLLGLFHFYPETQYLSRVFHVVELNFGDSNLRFQFGLNNPDYPATIRRKNFVLDLDAYYPGLQEKDDVLSNLDIFHEKIQEIFEMSVTDNLRRKMNG